MCCNYNKNLKILLIFKIRLQHLSQNIQNFIMTAINKCILNFIHATISTEKNGI